MYFLGQKQAKSIIYYVLMNRYCVILQEYPTPRAHNRRAIIKYGLGGFILIALLFIIWFPLVIFSFANTVSV